jgi:hypothetical protein
LLDTQRTAAEARLTYQEKLLELSIAQAELEALISGSLQASFDDSTGSSAYHNPQTPQ